jgi:chemotaxis protein methyltransferase CheR
VVGPATHPPKPRDDTARAAAAMFEAAAALHEAGDYAGAAERLAPLLAREPAPAGACALLARVCANQGRLAEALAWCDQAVAPHRLSPGAHYLRATILDEQGDRAEAMASLRRAVYLDHRFVIAHFALASLATTPGKPSEARRHFVNTRLLLESYQPGDILPESGGITAGRLPEIITSTTASEVPS